MWGVVWYVGTLLAAFTWLLGTSLAQKLTIGELLFASIPVGTIGGAWLVFLTACMLSQLSPLTLLVSSILLAILISDRLVQFGRNARRLLARFPAQRTDLLVSLALAAAVSCVMWPLYSTRMIPERNGVLLSGGSCYGDLPIHMYLAESFLVGCNQDVSWSGMMSPIFAGERMTYPFLPDFHAAVIKSLGSSLRWGFLAPGFAMTVALWGLLYFFTLRVTGSRMGGIIAVALVIGAGGLGGPRWIAAQGWRVAMNADVVQHDPTGEWKHLWFAFVPHILLPQRGATFAYPMAVLSLLLVWLGTDTSGSGAKMSTSVRRSLLVHAALFAGSLPLVQAHAFIGIGIIIAITFVLDAHKWGNDVNTAISWALAGAVAIATGGPQMVLFQKTVTKGHEGKFLAYGWLYKNYEFGKPDGPLGFFRFWWHSLGPALHIFVVIMALYVVECVRAQRAAAALVKQNGSNGVTHFLTSLAAAAARRDEAAPPPHATAAAAVPGPLRMRAKALAAAAAARGEREAASSAPSPRLDEVMEEGSSPLSGGGGGKGGMEEGAGGDPLLGKLLSHFHARWFAPLFGRWSRALGVDRLDAALAPLNSLTLNGRALDTLKLAVGALVVFLVGNYINFQPWDRDNAKLFYIWVFVASPLTGSLLALPFEFVSGAPRGRALIGALTGTAQLDALSEDRTGVTSKAASGVAMRRSAAGVLGLVAPVALLLCTLSGFMLLAQEGRHQDVMIDVDFQVTGKWIIDNTPPKAVFVHNNYHLEPSGSIAGRPTLAAYFGWVSNHGYNFEENGHNRLQDRDVIMRDMCAEANPDVYGLLRRWGIRYVLAEYKRCGRDQTLSGQLVKRYERGRYSVWEVKGY